MVETEKLFVKNEEIKLEAEYCQSTSNITSAVLITHPHPRMGGSMQNNVVSGVFKKFKNSNISCLRFNFRAVGRSTGNHSNGRGELSDVRACIDFLINEKKNESIFVVGYSYGAAIGCSVVNYSEKVIGYVAISFPWDFMGAKYKKFSQSDKPKLFIQGDKDNIAVYSNFDAHYKDYQDPKKHVVIKGADHFYGGYENIIADKVYDFYMSLLN